MTRPIRCRLCGTLFVPEHPLFRIGSWRRCPRCRGPLPPPDGLGADAPGGFVLVLTDPDGRWP
jgi:hypothetical protein